VIPWTRNHLLSENQQVTSHQSIWQPSLEQTNPSSRVYSLEERGSDNTDSLDEPSGSLSDEEPEDDNSNTRPARTLYRFEGKAEFRELSVEAGDDVDVVKEELADGWSLVRNKDGEVGLLPRTYYTINPLVTIICIVSYAVHIKLHPGPRPPVLRTFSYLEGRQIETKGPVTPRGSLSSTPGLTCRLTTYCSADYVRVAQSVPKLQAESPRRNELKSIFELRDQWGGRMGLEGLCG